MHLPRRDFLKTTLAASATAALGSSVMAADKAASGREYYELRCYRLQPGTRLKTEPDPALLDAYLEGALLPALGNAGIKHTGVFTELDVEKAAGTSTPLP